MRWIWRGTGCTSGNHDEERVRQNQVVTTNILESSECVLERSEGLF
jgi:hypothetical protein